MFRKNKKKLGAILFLSSYMPLYIIIIFQNLFSIIDDNIYNINKLNFSTDIVIKGLIKLIHYKESYIIIIFFIFTIYITKKLKNFIKTENSMNNNYNKVILTKTKNSTHEYFINYFALYIFPFITLDLTKISGIFIFIFLIYIIGTIYINNELFYINPTLNILYKYNIFKVSFSYGDQQQIQDIILLSKRDVYDLKLHPSINISKLPLDGLYIEHT